MNESFKCKLDFDHNLYDIELSDVFNECLFRDIFDKITQIIELISNQKITFDSHHFEVNIEHIFGFTYSN